MDSTIYLPLFVLALCFSGILPVGIVIALFHWVGKLKKRRAPLTHKLLRLPGSSIRKQIDEVNFRIDEGGALLLSFPSALYAGIGTYIYFFEVNKPIPVIAIGIVSLSLILLFFSIRLPMLIRKRGKLRLDLECKIAVSQELNQLMREGYYVYHDFPAEGFNIDHIVIGKFGVFAIETLGRYKPVTKDRKNDGKVIYNGETLKFPTWTETKPLEQVNAHADWLASWLKDVVTDPVRTIPVLVLPGWFVEETDKKKYPTRVINPKMMLLKLKENQAGNLDDEIIQQIAEQVEARCRETEDVK